MIEAVAVLGSTPAGSLGRERRPGKQGIEAETAADLSCVPRFVERRVVSYYGLGAMTMNKTLRAGGIFVLVLLTSGCTEVTWWDAQGSWSGRVTLPGEVEAERESGITDPVAGFDEDRIRLCQLAVMDLGMTFVPIGRDRPAAIRVRTARPLCEEGRTEITGGSVLIWANPGSDPNILAAALAEAWTLTGEIEVMSYSDFGLPELDAGESATTERVQGTFSLTATDAAGAVIRIEGGTFELTVEASRVELSIS